MGWGLWDPEKIIPDTGIQGSKNAPDPGSTTLGERCEGLTFDFFAGSPHQGREGGILRVEDPVPSQTKPNIKNSSSGGWKHLCNMYWFYTYYRRVPVPYFTAHQKQHFKM